MYISEIVNKIYIQNLGKLYPRRSNQNRNSKFLHKAYT